jgi:spore maturation protein CgeB
MMRFVFLGLSITSSWGNGHATNYRGLVRALTDRGHDVLFLERDVPWYAAQRDLPDPPWGRTELYTSADELRERFETDVAEADVVVIGSYVPDGVAVTEWVLEVTHGTTVFYDIDTPVTLAKLERGDEEYLAARLVPRFDLYLSFTGGPILRRIEHEYGARRARAFYCLVDPEAHRPVDVEERWLLGYLGTHSADRQPALDALLVEPARRLPSARFCVAGPQYPPEIAWPENVERIEHLPPSRHPAFYSAQRYTLNVARAEMLSSGWSPSVRLFEAAACGVPVLTVWWRGLEDFFLPDREIVVAANADEAVRLLTGLSEEERQAIAGRARRRVLVEHTAERRAEELERHLADVRRTAAV